MGDWVIGTGGAANELTGHLVYAMKVTETMTFDAYFIDPRFQAKKPNLAGSLKQAFGDNIYWRNAEEEWQQLDSHHSLADGSPNPENVKTDTQTNRLLLSDHFAYFGAEAPAIPDEILSDGGEQLLAGRGYRCEFSAAFVERFVGWFEELGASGAIGRPREWLRNGGLRTR